MQVISDKPKKKENLKWKINILEALIGHEPEIPLAKAALRKQPKNAAEVKEPELEGEKLNERLNQLKAEKISRKMFHAQKELAKIFKTARAFEMQRLVKRLRSARNVTPKSEYDGAEADYTPLKKSRRVSAVDVRKYEEEFEFIKNLDLTTISMSALHTKLSKHGSLKSNSTFQYYLTMTPTLQSFSTNQAFKDAESRLLNTKAVKDVLEKNLRELESIVFGKRKEQDERGANPDRGEESEGEADEKRDFGSDKNEGSEDDNSEEHQQSSINAFKKQRFTAEDMHGSNGGSVRPLQSGETRRILSVNLKAKKPSNAKPKNQTSEFVMSLNSGYNSNSGEEDWDDPNFDKYYGVPVTGEKKRKGQRARRKEYERLYGKEANHIKLWRKEKPTNKSEQFNNKLVSRHDNSNYIPSHEQDSLHPSWKAKKRQQETLAKSMSQVSTGKKIVFGDDGEVSTSREARNHNKANKTEDPNVILHPSWEAKKLEKEAIAKALAGGIPANKITFI